MELFELASLAAQSDAENINATQLPTSNVSGVTDSHDDARSTLSEVETTFSPQVGTMRGISDDLTEGVYDITTLPE
eukprot:m.3712 g.3712  ORF g.3712 m.3712 type:complete len:76 (+) comp3004_c0_seq1:248-475(+)